MINEITNTVVKKVRKGVWYVKDLLALKAWWRITDSNR